MKIKSTWILGILLVSILAFWGWKGFENSLFITGKTARVSGKIIDVFPSNEVKTYSRRIKYVYSVNGKDYVDFKKLDTNDKKQVIGNELRINYSLKNPKRNKVEKLLNNFSRSNTRKYYSNTENGYIEMYLLNGVFKYKEYVGGGEIINNIIGDYSTLKDTIQFNNYNFEGMNTETQKPFSFIPHPEKWNQLIETNSKQIFTKLRNRN